MTENGGSCTHIWQYDPTSSGTVGPPLCNTELKLIDVPSMGYSAEDKPYPRGEICFRGDHGFKGYYKGVCHVPGLRVCGRGLHRAQTRRTRALRLTRKAGFTPVMSASSTSVAGSRSSTVLR